ncbi:MAG: ABC transporter permease [Gammaproteobacteria bacterium]|nr:ABC transporter permease [Gammaproteobacteria bacterium]
MNHTSRNLLGRLHAYLIQRPAVRGYLLLSPTLGLVAALMCIPILAMGLMSFWHQTGHMSFDTSGTLQNYVEALTRDMYQVLFLRSLSISGLTTIATVVMAFPLAYFIAFYVKRHKMVWIILVTLPFWTSYLLRVFAWKVILGYNGAVNSGLISLGVIDEPLTFLMYNPTAVVITLTHAWATVAILPIYVSLEKIDRSVLEAATDLGDSPFIRFFRVVLPLALPGILAASVLIFIPTVGDYVTPSLVGGSDGYMIANVIQFQFGRGSNWPSGAAISLTSMTIVAVLVIVFAWTARRLSGRNS